MLDVARSKRQGSDSLIELGEKRKRRVDGFLRFLASSHIVRSAKYSPRGLQLLLGLYDLVVSILECLIPLLLTMKLVGICFARGEQ